MLILSRQLGESVVIDDLVVTVDSYADDHAILSLMKTNCEFLRKVTAPFHEPVEISDHVRAWMVRAERDRVRLGFDAPRDCSISRWEAWRPDQMR
jgi:sRNA-binding carbon storage regulator CsrA